MVLREENIIVEGKTFTIKELSFGARIFSEDGKTIKSCIEPWEEFEKIMHTINRKDTDRIMEVYGRVNEDDSPNASTKD